MLLVCGFVSISPHNKSNGIGLIINPSSLLADDYQPTQLFHPKKKACGEVLLQTEEILHELRLEDNAHPRKLVVQPEELSLSQMDLTMNLWLSNDADLPELIRLFKKAKLPPSFKRCKGKNREIDRHCFVMNCHTVAFKAYDKIYELQRDGRCPAKLAGKKLLRIEVSLKREAFVKKLRLNRADDLHTMLKPAMTQWKISYWTICINCSLAQAGIYPLTRPSAVSRLLISRKSKREDVLFCAQD